MPSSSDFPLASPSDYHSFVIKMTSPFLSIEVNKQVCDNRDSNRWGTFHFVFSIAHTFCHNACTTNGRHRDLGSFGVYIWQVVSLANVVFWFWAGGCTDGGDDGQSHVVGLVMGVSPKSLVPKTNKLRREGNESGYI